MRKVFKLIFILAVFFVYTAYAGETGKIAGRVIDANTKEPLVGVNVVVEGTELGAATDATGHYLIINVPVGTYDVTASYVGYEPVRVKGVKVIVDQTTYVDFQLKPTVIEIQKPVEVTAERPMIIKTAVQTTRIAGEEELKKLPLTVVTQLVNLQAGVVTHGGFAHVRGGRYDEVLTLVDGISAVDPFYQIAYHRPPSAAVSEVSIITGGFDAEYGEAMSGVVQIIKKEGGEKHSGVLRYTSDDFLPSRALDFGYNFYQFSLSGPLFSKRFRYAISGELMHTEDASPTKYKLQKPRDEYTGDIKLTYKLPKSKFSLSYYTACYQWQAWANSWKYWLDHYAAVRSFGDQLAVNFNTVLKENMILDLKAGYHYYDRLQTVRDKEYEKRDKSHILEKLGLWDLYRFKSEDYVFKNPDGLSPESAVFKLWKDKDAKWTEYNVSDNNPWGVPLFYCYGDYRLWHYRQSKTYDFKGDFTYIYKKIHEIKTGYEAKFYSLWLLENSLPWSSNPFWDAYKKYPWTFAYYLQDRADFGDLVVRAGLRLDMLNPASRYRKYGEDGRNVLDTTTTQAKIKYKISPRLGISFPVTEKMKFRFSYGHFFQTPTFTNLYESLFADIIQRGNIIVGNPDLNAQKTISYESGLEWQMSDFWGADITLFYKDIYDLVGTRPVPALPMGYTIITNVEYGRVFGFEVGLQKRLSNYWSGKLAYTFQIAKGTAAEAWQWYTYNYQGIPFTQIDYYLDYDQRHVVNLDLGLSFPSDFVFIPLRDFDVGMIFNFGSGFPYTPTDVRGTRIGDLNSARMPATWNIDARLSKDIKIGHLTLSLFCDILNVTNRLNVTNVYSATGAPDWDGQVFVPGQFSWGQIPGDAGYHPARDYNHDGWISQMERYDSYIKAREDAINNPGNYGPPRRVRVGIGFGF
jgi:outer membrane receptor protein involved in Fe transport